MPDPKARATRALGMALGAAILAGWLVAWRVSSDEADRFAPATIFAGFACWFLSSRPRAERRPPLRLGLRAAAYGALGLGVAASLSLGALLPPGLADWVSPPLGKFGGPLALGQLTAILALAVLGGLPPARRGLLLDAILLSAGASIWIQSQLDRQASFPTPPTTVAALAPRLTALCWLGLAFAVGAALLHGSGWRAARRAGAGGDWTGGDYDRWLWRWAGAFAAIGLVASLAVGAADWWRFAVLGLANLAVGVAVWRPWRRQGAGAAVLRGTGWLLLMTLAIALIYFATTEDLEPVLLRNTVEHRALKAWPAAAGVGLPGDKPLGALAGTVRDGAGQPLGGASVVVSDLHGGAYSAVSNAEGRYRLEGVPAGNYRPLAVAPRYLPAPAGGAGERVATIRGGRTAEDVNFRLRAQAPFDPRLDDHRAYDLRIEPPLEITIDGLEPSTVQRRAFTFANRGKRLDGGLVHEPLAAAGAGPFPILLIIYPGEAQDWEGVSVPLAARGYVVVSYFPRRLLDLDGDLADLHALLASTLAGHLSARGDAGKIVLVGGSVSTVYTYLLARDLVGSPAGQRVKAAIQYGGLFDLFAYRRSWEAGEIKIDPGISALEYLLIALGRPDTRPELYLRFSPRYGLGRSGLPPTLLVHTDRDRIVPPEQSRIADETLARHGIPHRLLTYPELEHYLDTSKPDPAQLDMLSQTVAFLQSYTGR